MPLGCHELLVTQLSEMKLLSPDVLQTARLSEESGKSEQTLKIPSESDGNVLLGNINYTNDFIGKYKIFDYSL